jgi:hypothetical protein
MRLMSEMRNNSRIAHIIVFIFDIMMYYTDCNYVLNQIKEEQINVIRKYSFSI